MDYLINMFGIKVSIVIRIQIKWLVIDCNLDERVYIHYVFNQMFYAFEL